MTEFKIGDKVIVQGPRHDYPLTGTIERIWPERNAAHVSVDTPSIYREKFTELVNLNELKHASIV